MTLIALRSVLVICCWTGIALAETPLPALRVEPATESSILYVKDADSQPPLTAFLIELVKYPGSYYQLWEDDLTSESIAPGTEKKITISNMTVGAVPDYVKLTAAIYADGTTAGIPEKVAQLVERRKMLRQTTKQLISRLEKAKGAGASANVAAEELNQWAGTMPALTRSTQNSQPAINQSAAKSLIHGTSLQLGKQSLDETVKQLHQFEEAFATSKPSL